MESIYVEFLQPDKDPESRSTDSIKQWPVMLLTISTWRMQKHYIRNIHRVMFPVENQDVVSGQIDGFDCGLSRNNVDT